MEPDASFSMLLEEIANGEWDDAVEHAESLHNWLRRGGFPPGGGKIRKTSIYALLYWVLQNPQRDPDLLKRKGIM